MCCGQAFWKRVFVFGLTFGLGVSVAGLFISGKVQPAVKPVVVPAAENKNCVPMDENLKYERLATDEKTAASDTKKVYSQLKTRSSETKEKSLKAEKEKQKNPESPQPYNPSKDSAEVKYLVHKERCFETPAQ
jgi:hypothetical protein